jgi:hypothetical protein
VRRQPVPTCCEPGCTNPIDKPRSKVRCVDHYTPPHYGGHIPWTAAGGR